MVRNEPQDLPPQFETEVAIEGAEVIYLHCLHSDGSSSVTPMLPDAELDLRGVVAYHTVHRCEFLYHKALCLVEVPSGVTFLRATKPEPLEVLPTFIQKMLQRLVQETGRRIVQSPDVPIVVQVPLEGDKWVTCRFNPARDSVQEYVDGPPAKEQPADGDGEEPGDDGQAFSILTQEEFAEFMAGYEDGRAGQDLDDPAFADIPRPRQDDN